MTEVLSLVCALLTPFVLIASATVLNLFIATIDAKQVVHKTSDNHLEHETRHIMQ